MTQPKFTPGPWKLDGECFTSGGRYFAPRIFSHYETDKPRFIAEIAVGNLWEENGALIAAAPDLYNVAVYVRDNCDTDGVLQGLLDKALTKAGRA